MKTVYKFKVNSENCRVEIPVGAQILSAGAQALDLFVWAIVETDETQWKMVDMTIVGTGHPLPRKLGKFLSTVQMEHGLVFHVFLPESQTEEPK